MKNIHFSNAKMPKATLLTLGLTWLFLNPISAQTCQLACNSMLVVEVPTNGSYTLTPAEMAAGDLSQICPGGNFQTQILNNSVYLPAVGNMVFDGSHVGQTFAARLRDANSGNACWGEVQVIGEMLQDDTIRFQLCAELWKDNRPMKGTTLVFQPNNPAFPVSPTVFVMDSSQSCAEVTVVMSDYPPDATFSYTAVLPDTGFLNGVDIIDFCRIRQHILGISPLPAPFGIISGDANKSNSVTTFDLVEFRKLLVGANKSLPNNGAWRFIPDYTVFPNPANPFQGNWKSEISAAELSALNGGVAKVRGVKTGDVDGSVKLPGEAPLTPMPDETVDMTLPIGQVMAGKTVVIPVKFEQDMTFENIQVQFHLDPASLVFDSISSPLVPAFAEFYGYYDAATGRLAVTGYPGYIYVVPEGSPFINIHVKTLQPVDLPSAIGVVQGDPAWRNMAVSADCGNYTKLEAIYSGFVSTQAPWLNGLKVTPPSPNPSADRTFLEITCEKEDTGRLELTDLNGRLIYTETKVLMPGLTRWEIPLTALASGNIGIWRLSVAGQVGMGKVVRL